MEEPDFSKAVPRRLITMTPKYMAVCYFYDGIQYQNMCKYRNPDGTYNLSETCLAKLPPMPSSTAAIGLLNDLNSSSRPSSHSQSLVKYDDRQQSPMPPFNEFVSHYWPGLVIGALVLILSTLLMVNIISPIFRKKNKGPIMARVDESGNISLGKISFCPDDVLGMGSKGTFVYRGCFEKSQDCAIKRVVSQCLTLADREVDFLRSLHHPNLVRYLATEVDPQFIYIALELAEYTLRSVVEGKKLDEVCLSRDEICRQAALGLLHLHQLNIVHRDIKPENILISFPKRPNNERKVMISDFGLSKEISNFDTGHTSSVMRYFDGTQGWMAPEIIGAKVSGKNLAPSKAADIFSLGCVFHYIVFDGQHPFGDAVESRQFNIMSNKNVLNEFKLSQTDRNDNIRKELVVMCNNLVRAMLEPLPDERPPISSVLKFPMFWLKKDQLHFLSEVSDRLDKDKDVVGRVEKNRQRIFGFDWKQSLGRSLLDDIEGPGTKHRSYSERKLQDLLRVIRNKKNHYNDCSEQLKLDLGELPDQFLDYFNSRFPELIVHVYKAIQIYKHEKKFRDYYDQDDEYIFK